MRIATFHAELTRKGPGLLLRDLMKGDDAQINAIASLIKASAPDVVLLTKVDIDAGGRTLAALKDAFDYPHGLVVMPNSSKFIGDDRAAWAYFAGSGGMVLLSNDPVELVQHYNDVLWQDVDSVDLPTHENGTPYYSSNELQRLPVVTQGLWDVRIGSVTYLLFQNTAPVFDGPEDRNGKRSRDQLRLLMQEMEKLAPPFVLMGNTNLDPEAGDGDRAAMRAVLDDPALQDPVPRSVDGGANTAFWENPGAMRVSYILPSQQITVLDAAVFWPQAGPLRAHAEQASRHRLVWMDIMP